VAGGWTFTGAVRVPISSSQRGHSNGYFAQLPKGLDNVSQTITGITPGCPYQLIFAAQCQSNSGDDLQVDVKFGGTTITNIAHLDNQTYKTFVYSLRAPGLTTDPSISVEIIFTNKVPVNNQYINIDAVIFSRG